MMAGTPTSNPPSGSGGIELALPVSDRVQIQNILIIESRAKRGEDHEFEGVGFNHKITKVEYVKEEAERMIGVQITIILASTKDGMPQRDPALLIMARFMLNYKIASFEGLTEDNLRAFAGANGAYNVWPYWREFVQNTTVRMGLPPIVAPVFRIPIVSPPPSAEMPHESSHPGPASDDAESSTD